MRKSELDLNFDLLLKELPQSKEKEYRTALKLAHRETASISAETRVSAAINSLLPAHFW